MVGSGYLYLMERLLRRGDCVIDVGVNVGYFSALASCKVSLGGKVHSIEASPLMMERLKPMVEEVPDGPIRVYHSAVWKNSGTLQFKVATNSGWSSLIENDTFTTQTQVEVQAITLDEFVARENIKTVKLIKLDIEGAEMDALIGAAKLLSEAKVDFLLIEVEPFRLKAFGHSGQEMANLLDKYNYRPVCIILSDVILPITEKNLIPGASNCDYLYVRNELFNVASDAIWK